MTLDKSKRAMVVEDLKMSGAAFFNPGKWKNIFQNSTAAEDIILNKEVNHIVRRERRGKSRVRV